MRFLETRPAEGEYAPFYATYISRVPPGNLLDLLASQAKDTHRLLAPLDDTFALHRYAPGKWSIKEVLGHLADAERVFNYRALRFARADQTPLPGFDENAWVPAGGFDHRPLRLLLDDLAAVRGATLTLLAGLDEAAWMRRGTANTHPISVRALAAIIAGHELHHLTILRERYGVGEARAGR